LVFGVIIGGILIAAYLVFVDRFPRSQPASVHIEEAEKLYKEGKTDEAIEAYEEASKSDSEDGSIVLMLGLIYENKGAPEEADKYFKRGETLYRRKVDFYNARARLYIEDRRIDKAKTDVTEALKLEPQNPLSVFLLGNIYEAEERPFDALVQYQAVSNMEEAPSELVVMARVRMDMIQQAAPESSP
jgi:tetratricopeptide (TPR) repeat protein